MNNLTLEQMPKVVSEIRENQNRIIELLEKKDLAITVPNKQKKMIMEDAIRYLAEEHGVKLAKQTIYGLMHGKKIPFGRVNGSKRVFFIAEQLDLWVANGRNMKGLS